MPRVMQVIESTRTVGAGTPQHPFFTATEYHTTGGEFLAATPTETAVSSLHLAVPDLLAACRAFAALTLPHSSLKEVVECVDRARAAVAKAEGR